MNTLVESLFGRPYKQNFLLTFPAIHSIPSAENYTDSLEGLHNIACRKILWVFAVGETLKRRSGDAGHHQTEGLFLGDAGDDDGTASTAKRADKMRGGTQRASPFFRRHSQRRE